MTIKTLEFKLKLTKEHKSVCEIWLDGLRWVWNTGLELLENFYKFHSWDKLSQTWVPCSPVPWQYRKQGNKEIPYCWIGKKSSCPIPQPYRPCLLSGNPGAKPYYWLRPFFTQKNHPDKDWFRNIPSVFVNNILERLGDAWVRFRKGVNRKPKFRSRRTQTTTLETSQIKSRVYVEGRYIKVPGLGRLLVKGLDTRIPSDAQIKTLRICQFASGNYLQLSIKVQEVVLPESELACGIDMGTEYLYATDNNRLVKPPNYFKNSEKKLVQLQRKLSVSKRKQYPKCQASANHKKLQAKAGKLHEKIARQRRAFNHWHSSNLVKIYGGIAIEDIDFSELMHGSKQVVSSEPAMVRSRYNKALMDAGCGQFISFVEQKCQVSKRELQKVDPAYTSQDCPICGHRHQLDLRQRTFCCEKCHYQAQRKHAAAQVVRQRAVFERSYRGCHREVMPVESSTVKVMKQESQLARAGTANADEQVDRLANQGDTQSNLG